MPKKKGPVAPASAYRKAQLAARAKAGSLSEAAAYRVKIALSAYSGRIAQQLKSLPPNSPYAVALQATRQNLFSATNDLQVAIKRAVAEGRDVSFTEALHVYEEAGHRAATAAGLPTLPGLVGSGRITLLGAYENLGGAATWKTVLPQYVGAASQEVDRIISAGLTGGLSPQEVSRRLRGYLDGSQEFHQAFGADAFTELRKSPQALPPNLRGAARQLGWKADRIAISEIHNARAEAELSHFADDPMIDAVQWELSPYRGQLDGPDVCDMLAHSDFYGLGAGVYPIDKVPPPPHPHDRCERVPRIRPFEDYGKPKPSPKRGPSPGTIGPGPYLNVTADKLKRIRSHAFDLLKQSEQLPVAKGLSSLMQGSVSRAATHGLTSSETKVLTDLGAFFLPAGTPTRGLATVVEQMKLAAQGSEGALIALKSVLPSDILTELTGKTKLAQYATEIEGAKADLAAKGLTSLPAGPQGAAEQAEFYGQLAQWSKEAQHGNAASFDVLWQDAKIPIEKFAAHIEATGDSAALTNYKQALADSASKKVGYGTLIDNSWSLDQYKEMEKLGAIVSSSPDVAAAKAAAEDLANKYGFSGPLDEILAGEDALAQAASASAGFTAPAPAAPAPAVAPPLNPPAKAKDLMYHFDAPATGSNKGVNGHKAGFYTGSDGVKRYLKFYADPAQARSEALAAKIYRDLGVIAPEVDLFEMSDGTVGLASKLLPEVKGTIGHSYTYAEAEEVIESFTDDVFLANWDAVGTGGDNIIRTAQGLARVDQGGALRYRAQGGLKSAIKGYDLNIPTELQSFFDASKAPDYAALLKKAGLSSYKDLGQTFIDRVAAIDKLRVDAGGSWLDYITSVSPSMPIKEAEVLADMLESRNSFLSSAADALRSQLAKAAAPIPAVIVPAATPAPTAISEKGLKKLAKFSVKAPAGKELEALASLEKALAGDAAELDALKAKGWTPGGKIQSQMKKPPASVNPAPAPTVQPGLVKDKAYYEHIGKVDTALKNIPVGPSNGLKVEQAMIDVAQPGSTMYAARHGNLTSLAELKALGWDTSLLDKQLLDDVIAGKLKVHEPFLNKYAKGAQSVASASQAAIATPAVPKPPLTGPAAHSANVAKALAEMPGNAYGTSYPASQLDALMQNKTLAPDSTLGKAMAGDLKAVAEIKKMGYDTATLDAQLVAKAQAGQKFDLKGLPKAKVAPAKKVTPPAPAAPAATQSISVPGFAPTAPMPAAAQYADADLKKAAETLHDALKLLPGSPAGVSSKPTFADWLKTAANSPGNNTAKALNGDLTALAELKKLGWDTAAIDDYWLKEVLDGTAYDSLKELPVTFGGPKALAPTPAPVIPQPPLPALKYGVAGPQKLSQIETLLANTTAPAKKKVMWAKTKAKLEQQAMDGHAWAAVDLKKAGQLTPQFEAQLKKIYAGAGAPVAASAPALAAAQPVSTVTSGKVKPLPGAKRVAIDSTADFLPAAAPGVNGATARATLDLDQVKVFTHGNDALTEGPFYFQGGNSTTASLKASGVDLGKVPSGKLGLELSPDTSAPLAHATSQWSALALKSVAPLRLSVLEAGATDAELLTAVKKRLGINAVKNVSAADLRAQLVKQGYDSVVVYAESGGVKHTIKAIVIKSGEDSVRVINAVVGPGGKVAVPAAGKAKPKLAPKRLPGQPGLTEQDVEQGRARLKAMMDAKKETVAPDTARVVRARERIQSSVSANALKATQDEFRRALNAPIGKRAVSHSIETHAAAFQEARRRFIVDELSAEMGITATKAEAELKAFQSQAEQWFGDAQYDGALTWKVLVAELDPELAVNYHAGKFVDHSATLQAQITDRIKASLDSTGKHELWRKVAQLEQEFTKGFLREVVGADHIKLYRAFGSSYFTGPGDVRAKLGQVYLHDGNSMEGWSSSPLHFGSGYVWEAEIPIDDIQQLFFLAKKGMSYWDEWEFQVRGRLRAVKLHKEGY